MRRWISMSICLATPFLSACSLRDRLSQQSTQVAQTGQSIQQTQDNFKQAMSGKQARQKSQRVDKPWLAGRAVPLAREATLPQALRKNVDTTMMYRGAKESLVVLAERITQATGIPVVIKPEALLPAESFMPRLTLSSQAAVAVMPHTASLGQGRQPLPKVLDALSRRLGIYWAYQNDALVFFRTQTRVFDARVLSLSAQTDAHLGRSPGNQAGGFDHASRTSLTSTQQHSIEAIRARLEPFLTRAAVVAAQPGASMSIVVTDTPEALNAIGQFLARENRIMTRRVRLLFEEITLSTNEDLEFGFDWAAALNQGALAAQLASPALAAGVDAARVGLTGAHSVVQSSQMVLKALAQYGTVLRHTSVPVLTLNRRPVTHAVRTTFSYIDQIKTAMEAGGAKTPGAQLASSSVSQKEETVGTFLTLVPDAQEDGQVLLSVAYDNTIAQPLKTITFGDQVQRVQIQQVTIDGNGTVQQVALKPGQPMLISGFERKQDEVGHTRVAPDMPLVLGGVNRSSQSRIVTLILLTAQIEEGY
jgi:type IVB pilus formation R64 PilN family outer membrane protein